MEISGKTFVVTGGGSGLGAATVRMLAGEGANVLIADVDRERAETLAGELGSSVRFARADVADKEGMRAALEEARSAFGGPHGLVNCAGIGTAAKVVGKKGVHPLELFERTIRVNLVGTFNAIRLAAALMMENEPSDGDGERGVIVNTASVAAFDGQIGQAAYSASKGGIVAMTLPVARELASSGIRVATIAPGIFETPMLGELSEEVRRSLGEQIPFPRRLGRPGEYASLVRHIVENRMLNGEVIRLDGAIRMAPR